MSTPPTTTPIATLAAWLTRQLSTYTEAPLSRLTVPNLGEVLQQSFPMGWVNIHLCVDLAADRTTQIETAEGMGIMKAGLRETGTELFIWWTGLPCDDDRMYTTADELNLWAVIENPPWAPFVDVQPGPVAVRGGVDGVYAVPASSEFLAVWKHYALKRYLEAWTTATRERFGRALRGGTAIKMSYSGMIGSLNTKHQVVKESTPQGDVWREHHPGSVYDMLPRLSSSGVAAMQSRARELAGLNRKAA